MNLLESLVTPRGELLERGVSSCFLPGVPNVSMEGKEMDTRQALPSCSSQDNESW